MKPYADELRAMTDAIMNVIFDGGDENRRQAVFQALLTEVEANYYPDSVKMLCVQAIGSWRVAQTLTDPADKIIMQRSAMLLLLAAFGRINGLATIEDYIAQRNREVLGLR
ncbi:hypothetical protein [Kluyvera cryocrescens]|uniref:hypothetical protein n=1 Tax=Kluyvera cryocrescens TaxID=580 RepID=UPI0028A648C8|nr:hypothetical protein [Kluyvera cryocrescens]